MKTLNIKNKKININMLEKFGFIKSKKIWVYSTKILDGDFKLTVKILDNKLSTEIIELDTNEPYTLHLVENAQGKFVGKVKQEYEDIINNIFNYCFETNVFEFEQTLNVIEYVKQKYNSSPEYLWEKFPRNAVCRRDDNKKWYLALLSVQANKIGFDSEEIIEIIDLRAKKEDVPNLLKENNIYPAYHMNKKSWITIILDNSVDFEILCAMIDKSYTLANK